MRWLGRYLAGTKDRGSLTPDPRKGLEVWADAAFSGDFDPEGAGVNIDTAQSRHDYIMTYAGIPLLHKSQLQGECVLSSTKAELIGLSAALRKSTPILNICRR